jgi:hypothetical protein
MSDIKLDNSNIEQNSVNFPYEMNFENSINKNSDEILSKIKWQLDFTRKYQNLKFNPRNVTYLLTGLLRGDLAERLSNVMPIENIQIVFDPSGLSKAGLKVISLHELTGQKTKEGALKIAVERSLKESPPKGLEEYFRKEINDEGKRREMFDWTVREIVDGYSAKGSGINSGIFYGETTVPDNLLMNEKGEVAGFVEVKGYRPEEFLALMKILLEKDKEGILVKPLAQVKLEMEGETQNYNLGFDIESEIHFVDIFRSLYGGLPRLDVDMPILLRLPKDIPDNLLGQFGSILEKLGYQKVCIEKLPLTSQELTQRAKKLIKHDLEEIKLRKTRMQFSDKEIKILESFTSQ